MAFLIKNRKTDELARRLAGIKQVGITEAVHQALTHELEREQAKPKLVDAAVQFCRELRARRNPAKAKPVNKAFFDRLSGI
jgi:antitoxin VapB